MSNYNPFSLVDKTILVTGASSGIGRAIAIECSKMGASVVVTARNTEKLEQTLSQMSGDGHCAVSADLIKEDDVARLAAQLPMLNGIVHNAGVGSRVLAKSVKEKDIDTVMMPNFYAPVLLQSHLLKNKLIAKEASIVFIASRAAFAPTVGNALYSASKGALVAYSKVLGLELAPRKIRVNSICPAMVWTDFVTTDEQITGANYKEAELKYPLQRYGQPNDIAYLAIYLLSNASSWMTGSSIDITGGGNSL